MSMRKWYSEKRNPIARKRRFWDLGADLDKDGCLRILRLPCGATREGNRCIQLFQGDTEKNPVALDIVNLGSSNSVTLRTAADQPINDGARISRTGVLTGASSREIKENFKALHTTTLKKVLNNLTAESWNFIGEEERIVGPDAESFAEFTGYGDSRSINQTTFLGLTFACVKLVWKTVNALEKRVKALEPEPEKE